jgi:uncharacterized protein involved in oxidation of intracellular sulfur
MTLTSFILDDALYGHQRAYNALRLAGALTGREDQQVGVLLMADSVGGAKSGQKVSEGLHNLQRMLDKVPRKGEVALCRTGMDACALCDADLIQRVQLGTLAVLAEWTAPADKVLAF